MKLGVCASIQEAEVVRRSGFEYVECTVSELRPEADDAAWRRDIWPQFRDSPMPVEAFNVLLPGELKVVGPDVDEDRVRRFLERAFGRVRETGADTVVFGSGKARTIPDGFSRERGKAQLVQFLHTAADYAEPLGLTIVIEPLYRRASNTVHVLEEAVELAALVDRRAIRVLADFFHMTEENDALDHIVKYKEWIRHIHVSDNYEPPGSGNYPFDQFADCLERSGYDGRISVECIWPQFSEQAAGAAAFVRQALRL